jgi:hypothetical protein
MRERDDRLERTQREGEYQLSKSCRNIEMDKENLKRDYE